MPKGKIPAAETERRKRRILEILIKKHRVCIDDLADFNINTEHKIAWRSLRNLLDDYYDESLKDQDIPIEFDGNVMSLHAMEMANRWEKTAVGHRLESKTSTADKGILATKVIDLLIDLGPNIKSVLLSSGISVYKVSEKLFSRRKELPAIQHIQTTNMLVLDNFLLNRPKNMTLFLIGNRFMEDTGSLKITDYEQEKPPINIISRYGSYASILGFTGLSEKGFYVDEDWEINEMFMLLRPENSCKLIIIPMEWGKIAPQEAYIVKTDEVSGKDVLLSDSKDGEKTKKYILVTNPPEGKVDSDPYKKGVLEFWEEKGMCIEIVKP